MPLGKPPHCLDYTLKIKILLSSLLIRPLVTQPLSPKTREGDGFVRKLPFGVRAPTLRAMGSKTPSQKLLARRWVDPENFVAIHQPNFWSCA